MKTMFVLVLVALAVFAVVPAEAQYPTLYAWGAAGYGQQQPSTTQQIHEWLGLAERGFGLVPQAAAGVALTEKIWQSRDPRPQVPVQPAVYYPPPAPPPAPPAQTSVTPATGRLVVVTGPGELFLNGESQGQFKNRDVKYYDLPVGNHSLIMRTEKKVLIKEAMVRPSATVVVNLDP